MNDRPETKFAWNGDVALAYQVIGDGPIDIVYLQGMVSNIDLNWESPHLARFLKGLSGFGRLIIMDRRGWGCSDRFSPTDVPPFETLTDDLLSVMDAAGSDRAAIFASLECTAMVMMFAATHPERVSSLMLCDPVPVWIRTDDTPWLPDEEGWEQELRRIHDLWGTLGFTEGADAWEARWDPAERDWYTRMQRATMTPGSMVAEYRAYMGTDIRDILGSIYVPTLVLGLASGEENTSPENGRFLSSRIPSARVVEMEQAEESHWLHWYGRAGAILTEVGSFLVERREEEASFDRLLATVLFTDVVGSTEKAAQLGDARWKALLERQNATVRAMLARYRGTEIKTMGDGFLATFDGPARAVKCAQAICEAVRPLGLEVRAGCHTGEIELLGADVGGIAVHIGARVGALAAPSEVLVSSTVKDLTAGSGLVFEDAGEHELKGVPDRWHLYRVVAG